MRVKHFQLGYLMTARYLSFPEREIPLNFKSCCSHQRCCEPETKRLVMSEGGEEGNVLFAYALNTFNVASDI